VTIVVDASVALDWCFRSEQSRYANKVLDHVLEEGATVPALWLTEVSNGLLTGRRRGRITAAEVAQALSMLLSLRLEVVSDPPDTVLPGLVEVGERFGLTAYDAAYLALAMREGHPLATNDDALRAAGRKAGVLLFKGS